MQSVKNTEKAGAPRGKLNAYSLAGLGVGGIIGSGFFLGSALSIEQAGPSVILAFLIGGFIISQVLGAVTSISINRPVTGSYKVYAEQFLGKYAGFTLGWVLYTSNVLALGSEAVAAGVFLRYWLPQLSLPVLAVTTTVLVVAINRLNTADFSLVESAMAVVKVLAVVLFIVVGVSFVASHGVTARPDPFASAAAFFPNGVTGLIQSMLVAVFTYSGISTAAMATSKVRRPEKDIPRATVIIILSIVILYVAAIFLVVCTLGKSSVGTDVSPFVESLGLMGAGWASSAINAAIFVAAFSVMLGTFFGSVQILVSLCQAKEAPAALGKAAKRGFYRNAWLMTGILSLIVVGISFLISSKLFNYLISACSYFSFFGWTINLIVYMLWLRRRGESERFTSPLALKTPGAVAAIILIALLAVVGLTVRDYRVGFYTAAVFLAVFSAAYAVLRHKKVWQNK